MQIGELAKRLLVTLGALVIYRLGTCIPLPGVDFAALQEVYGRNPGGTLGSIFAIGIWPYLTASFWISLTTAGWRRFRGDAQRKKLDRLARLTAVILVAVQAYGVALALEGAGRGGHSLVADPGLLFRLTTMITLTGGSAFLIWIADQITGRGLGNGLGLILFTGIVARLPKGVASLLELGRTGAVSARAVALVLVLMVGTVAFIVLMETAQRRFVVQYRPLLLNDRFFEGEGSHLRVKLNNAGIIPAIFASALLLLPATFASFGAGGRGWAADLAGYVGHGSVNYMLLYALVIVGLCLGYTAIMLQPTEMAERLQDYGGSVPGYEPGEPTAAHFRYVLRRLTLVGGVYLALICLIPELLIRQYSVPFYFGGSSLLIAVAIALDTLNQLRSHLLARR